MSDAVERHDIPVPGQPGNAIEALSSEELAEVVLYGCSERFPKSWTWALACEVTLLRAEADRLQSDLAADRKLSDMRAAEVEALRWAIDESGVLIANGTLAQQLIAAAKRKLGGGQ